VTTVADVTVRASQSIVKVGRALLLAACLVSLVWVPAAEAVPSTLDSSFGVGGKVTTTIGDYAGASALVLQPDGKLVAAGFSSNRSEFGFALARYNSNGALDPAFGSDGTVTTAIGSGAGAFALVLQPDGKLVAAGSSSNGSQTTFALARYKPDGSLDPAFGSDGRVTTEIGADAAVHALVLQPDGKLVAAGISANAGRVDFALARYNPDGSLDTSFNGTGKVTTAIGSSGNDVASAVALQPDGKLVAAGTSYNGTSPASEPEFFALARYNPNGSLDTSFNGTGKLTTAIGSFNDASALALQSDGKLVAAGTSWGDSHTSDFALVRYNPDGSLDTSFNRTGKVTTAIGPLNTASAVALQPDGKLVAAGSSSNGSDTLFALARYDPDGSLDTSFNGTGEVTTTIGPAHDDNASSLALQPDGKIVAAGDSDNCLNHVFALARYLGSTPRGAKLCLVPKVTGKTLPVARKAIKRAHCTVGKVTRKFSATVKRDHVISQKPKPGAKRPAGSSVELELSKGKKT
jgi:uncharacterized delta-60 repeat protein